jgi:hypothetical protein
LTIFLNIESAFWKEESGTYRMQMLMNLSVLDTVAREDLEATQIFPDDLENGG